MAMLGLVWQGILLVFTAHLSGFLSFGEIWMVGWVVSIASHASYFIVVTILGGVVASTPGTSGFAFAFPCNMAKLLAVEALHYLQLGGVIFDCRG